MKKLIIGIGVIVVLICVAFGFRFKASASKEVTYTNEFHPSEYSDITVRAHNLLAWYDQIGLTDEIIEYGLDGVYFIEKDDVVELYDHQEHLLGAVFYTEEGYDELDGYIDDEVEAFLDRIE